MLLSRHRRQRSPSHPDRAGAHRPRRDPAPEPVPAPAPKAAARQQRERHASVPQDLALYTCGCGYVFEAAVTTAVACPHCGAGQAW